MISIKRIDLSQNTVWSGIHLFLETDGSTGYWGILLHLSRRELFCKACSKSKWLLKFQEAMAKCFKSCHNKVYWLTFGIYFWILLLFLSRTQEIVKHFWPKNPTGINWLFKKKCFPGWTWGFSLIMTGYCCCCSFGAFKSILIPCDCYSLQ